MHSWWSKNDLGLFFKLKDLGNFLNNWNKFFNIIWYLSNLLNSCINGDYFLFKPFNLLNLLLNVNFRNLFKFSFFLNNYSFLYLRYYLSFVFSVIFLYDLLYYLSHWFNMNSLSIDVNRDCFFKINWNRAFNRLINNFLNKLYFLLFIWNSDYLIDVHFNWNLLPLNHNTLFVNLLYLNISTSFNILHHYLIRGYFYWAIYCYINDFLTLNFLWYLNIHILRNIVNFRRHMYRYLNNLFDDFLNYLRNLHYPLNYSWDYYNFFYNFLNLHNFRYLY